MKIDNNLDRKGNSKGFHKGSEPEKFTPDDYVKGVDGTKNKVNAVSEPNTDRGNTKNWKLVEPKNPALNAVPMANNHKDNKKNYGVVSYTGDSAGKMPMAEVPVGGVPRPNKIS